MYNHVYLIKIHGFSTLSWTKIVPRVFLPKDRPGTSWFECRPVLGESVQDPVPPVRHWGSKGSFTVPSRHTLVSERWQIILRKTPNVKDVMLSIWFRGCVKCWVDNKPPFVTVVCRCVRSLRTSNSLIKSKLHEATTSLELQKVLEECPKTRHWQLCKDGDRFAFS